MLFAGFWVILSKQPPNYRTHCNSSRWYTGTVSTTSMPMHEAGGGSRGYVQFRLTNYSTILAVFSGCVGLLQYTL